MHFLTDRETQGFLLCMSSCLFSLFNEINIYICTSITSPSVLWFLRLCTASHNLDWVSIVWSVLTARVVQISTCTIKWCQSNTNSCASVRLINTSTINCTDLDLSCYESHCFVRNSFPSLFICSLFFFPLLNVFVLFIQCFYGFYKCIF